MVHKENTDKDQQYFFYPRMLSPALGKTSIVSAYGLRPPSLLPTRIAEILGKCDKFASLDQHVANTWHSLPLLHKIEVAQDILQVHSKLFGEVGIGWRMFKKMLANILRRLAEEGYFISRENVLGLAKNSEDAVLKVNPISTLATVTHDRPTNLKRWLESYGTQSKKFDRKHDFAIYDDSVLPESSSAYQNIIYEAQHKLGLKIRWGGLSEKRRYAQHLVQAHIPEHVVNFCLFDAYRLGYSYGANMNALILDSVGDRIFSADDDTVCRLNKSPLYQKGVALSNGSNPFRNWYYPTRAQAIAEVPEVEDDFLDVHEAYLGLTLGDCISKAEPTQGFDWGTLQSQHLRLIQKGYGRVLVSLSGLLGDSGSESPLPRFFASGEERENFLLSEEIYRRGLLTREMLKVASKTTLAGAVAMMPTFCGLDNREILPPFFPNFRNSDSCFGELIKACSPSAFFAYQPWALLHEPPGERRYTEQNIHLLSSEFWPEFVTRRIIKSFYSDMSQQNMAQTMELVGQHIMRIAAMSHEDFREYLINQDLMSKTELLLSYQTLLEQFPKSPEYWTNDVKRLIREGEIGFQEPFRFAPLALSRKFGEEKSAHLVQELVYNYGELISWWPQIVAASKELKARGIRLAEAI